MPFWKHVNSDRNECFNGHLFYGCRILDPGNHRYTMTEALCAMFNRVGVGKIQIANSIQGYAYTYTYICRRSTKITIHFIPPHHHTTKCGHVRGQYLSLLIFVNWRCVCACICFMCTRVFKVIFFHVYVYAPVLCACVSVCVFFMCVYVLCVCVLYWCHLQA